MPLITTPSYNVIPPSFGDTLGPVQTSIMTDSSYVLPNMGFVSSSKVLLGVRDLANNGMDTAVLDISGTTVTSGTTFAVQGNPGVTYTYPEINVLDSGRAHYTFFTIGSPGANRRVYSRVNTFSGSAFTGGGGIQTTVTNTLSFAGGTLVDTDKLVLAWNVGDTDDIIGAVQTVASTTITQNTSVVLDNAGGALNAIGTIVKVLDAERVLILYQLQTGASTYEIRAMVVNVSATSVASNTSVILDSDSFPLYDGMNIIPLDATRVAVTWKSNASNNYNMNILTISGSPQVTVTPGTTQVFFSTSSPNRVQAELMDTDFISMVYNDHDDSDSGKIINATVSGTSISFGSPKYFRNVGGSEALGDNRPAIKKLSTGTGIVVWPNASFTLRAMIIS